MLCPSCGSENRDGARFCDSCAAALTAPTLVREQRKTVTVLFCDVAGSTALGEKLDPEALRLILARYFERMKAIVEYHGGTVEKFIGDAVMAVFGVPVLHEDDALRALRAALEMREAFPELGIQGRIGVTTGEVVTGTEERLATGDAVNVAARLEQAAEPGEILIGDETYRLTRDAAVVDVLEPRTLKGKAGPVAAHRLISVHGDGRVPPEHVRDDGRPLAGAAPAGERVGADDVGARVSALHRARSGRSRQVTSGGGVPGLARRHARRSRTLPSLRRGHHVLAGGGGRQAAPRGRPRSRRSRDDRARSSATRSSSPRARRSPGRSASSSRRSPGRNPSSACSTTSTGARRRSSTSSSTWPISRAMRPSCCSAWRGRISSTAGQAGAAARSTPPRCCSSRLRLPRRRC